jgi:hypothetical protein
MTPTISQEYWENLAAIIVAFAVLALIIERALYQIFDSRIWKKIEEWLNKQTGGDFLDLKPYIAAAVSIIIVFKYKLDMIAMIYKVDTPHTISLVITGLFLSGGSTGIYKFFKRARELKDAIQKEAVAKAGEGGQPGEGAQPGAGGQPPVTGS